MNRRGVLVLVLSVLALWTAQVLRNQRHHHSHYLGRIDSPSGQFTAAFAEDEWSSARDHSVAVAPLTGTAEPDWSVLFDRNAFHPSELPWESDTTLLLKGRIHAPDHVPLLQHLAPLGLTVRIEPPK